MNRPLNANMKPPLQAIFFQVLGMLRQPVIKSIDDQKQSRVK
ncbi:hypothetical protein [Symmachiella macrocystis]|nr:hypothetical protein [Symmachiella macrocystis]